MAGPARWALVSDGGDPLGAAMLTPPWNLFLSALPAGAAADIADVLAAAGIELPGVAGAADAVREFVDRWTTIHDVQSRLDRRQRAYVLDELLEPDILDGFARLVRPGEAPLLAAWWQRFHDEAVPRDPALDWREVATTQIERGGAWCWCVGDTPVSFAAANHMGDLARIGPVYTPPDRRGRGFAAAATAAAVRDALAQGAHHVMLYADVENPTSNALYLPTRVHRPPRRRAVRLHLTRLPGPPDRNSEEPRPWSRYGAVVPPRTRPRRLSARTAAIVLGVLCIAGCGRSTNGSDKIDAATITTTSATTVASTTSTSTTTTTTTTSTTTTSTVAPSSSPAPPTTRPPAPDTTAPPPITVPPPAPTTAPRRRAIDEVDSHGATRVITVVSPSWAATTATLIAWQRTATGWDSALGPFTADVGARGISNQKAEGDLTTPAGNFTFGIGFGTHPNPGYPLGWFRLTSSDYWDEGPASPHYNTHQTWTGPGPYPYANEHLIDQPVAYEYAALIDYNVPPSGNARGSGIFLHVSLGHPTAGCVSLPRGDLLAVLSWIGPGTRIVIAPRQALGAM